MSEEVMVEIKKHYLAKSKEKGTPSVKIQVATCAGEEILYYDCWLTEKCYKQTIKVLREVLGWKGKDLSELDGTGTFAGVKAVAVIEEEDYNDKTQRKIKFLNSIGGHSSDLSEDEKSAMQAGFEEALTEHDGSNSLPF